MRFFINATTLVKGGGIQVGDAFIRELPNNPEHQYMVVCSPQVAASLGDLSGYPTFIRFKVIQPLKIKDRILRLFRINHYFDNLVQEFSADAVFTVFGPSYWRPKVPHLCGFAKPQYVYSDSPFFKEISFIDALKLRIKRFFQLRSFQLDVDALVTENSDVSDKIQTLFPGKRIETISNCYNQIFDTPSDQKEYSLPPFDGITLLTVSALYPHKNFTIFPFVAFYLEKNFPDLPFRFIITLPEESFPIAKAIRKHFIFVGKTPIVQVPSLYRQATFMFLPTLLECFSASWIEAMRMNVPILTSDLSFAHGICADAAEYFNPLDVADIANKIVKLYRNSARQKEIVECGNKRLLFFNNNSTRASKYISIMESISKSPDYSVR